MGKPVQVVLLIALPLICEIMAGMGVAEAEIVRAAPLNGYAVGLLA